MNLSRLNLKYKSASGIKEPNKILVITLIRVGRDDALEIYRILLQFSLNPLPADAVIISAFLKLYMQVAGAGQQAGIITPYAIDSSWNVNTVTWNNQPSFNAATSGSSQKAGTLLTQHSFDITTIVQQWYDNSLINDGILLKTSEMQDKTLTNVQANMFNSAYIPVVEINYVLKCDCISPGPIFIEDMEEISTDSTNHYSTTRNTSLTKTVTFLIKNNGVTAVSANIQISPDGVGLRMIPEL
jgi:hypothetical protein